MQLKDKTILVTGGAGFIGSNIVDSLVALGVRKTVVLDNLETGTLINLQGQLDAGRIEFIKGDIRNYDDCLKASAGCDIVLHQAALGSVPRSIRQPLDTHATNVTGFVNMLEAARNNKVKRFIYASSSSVYGDNTTLPKVEEVTGNPLSPYAVSKKTNELYAAVFSNLYNMTVIGLRYFNVFGPRQNPAGPYAAVIPIFINRLLKNQTCIIYGDGLNKRDFTYVSNVVQANLRVAAAPEVPAYTQVYNVAYGATETVLQLYNLIREKTGVEKDPVFEQSRPGEIKDSFANIDKMKAAFGYTPETPLEEGVEKTIAWYRQQQI